MGPTWLHKPRPPYSEIHWVFPGFRNPSRHLQEYSGAGAGKCCRECFWNASGHLARSTPKSALKSVLTFWPPLHWKISRPQSLRLCSFFLPDSNLKSFLECMRREDLQNKTMGRENKSVTLLDDSRITMGIFQVTFLIQNSYESMYKKSIPTMINSPQNTRGVGFINSWGLTDTAGARRAHWPNLWGIDCALKIILWNFKSARLNIWCKCKLV